MCEEFTLTFKMEQKLDPLIHNIINIKQITETISDLRMYIKHQKDKKMVITCVIQKLLKIQNHVIQQTRDIIQDFCEELVAKTNYQELKAFVYHEIAIAQMLDKKYKQSEKNLQSCLEFGRNNQNISVIHYHLSITNLQLQNFKICYDQAKQALYENSMRYNKFLISTEQQDLSIIFQQIFILVLNAFNERKLEQKDLFFLMMQQAQVIIDRLDEEKVFMEYKLDEFKNYLSKYFSVKHHVPLQLDTKSKTARAVIKQKTPQVQKKKAPPKIPASIVASLQAINVQEQKKNPFDISDTNQESFENNQTQRNSKKEKKADQFQEKKDNAIIKSSLRESNRKNSQLSVQFIDDDQQSVHQQSIKKQNTQFRQAQQVSQNDSSKIDQQQKQKRIDADYIVDHEDVEELITEKLKQHNKIVEYEKEQDPTPNQQQCQDQEQKSTKKNLFQMRFSQANSKENISDNKNEQNDQESDNSESIKLKSLFNLRSMMKKLKTNKEIELQEQEKPKDVIEQSQDEIKRKSAVLLRSVIQKTKMKIRNVIRFAIKPKQTIPLKMIIKKLGNFIRTRQLKLVYEQYQQNAKVKTNIIVKLDRLFMVLIKLYKKKAIKNTKLYNHKREYMSLLLLKMTITFKYVINKNINTIKEFIKKKQQQISGVMIIKKCSDRNFKNGLGSFYELFLSNLKLNDKRFDQQNSKRISVFKFVKVFQKILRLNITYIKLVKKPKIVHPLLQSLFMASTRIFIINSIAQKKRAISNMKIIKKWSQRKEKFIKMVECLKNHDKRVLEHHQSIFFFNVGQGYDTKNFYFKIIDFVYESQQKNKQLFINKLQDINQLEQLKLENIQKIMNYIIKINRILKRSVIVSMKQYISKKNNQTKSLSTIKKIIIRNLKKDTFKQYRSKNESLNKATKKIKTFNGRLQIMMIKPVLSFALIKLIKHSRRIKSAQKLAGFWNSYARCQRKLLYKIDQEVRSKIAFFQERFKSIDFDKIKLPQLCAMDQKVGMQFDYGALLPESTPNQQKFDQKRKQLLSQNNRFVELENKIKTNSKFN